MNFTVEVEHTSGARATKTYRVPIDTLLDVVDSELRDYPALRITRIWRTENERIVLNVAVI